ncbi:MAG: hypothetical protein ACRDDZ_06335 [Marinifilaceae bacterium]
MDKAISVHNLLNKKYRKLEFSGEWEEAFNRPSDSGSWFIYGMSSNGKSSFVHQLAKYLAELGKTVDYISLEEGADDTIQEAALRAGWDKVGSKIRIREPLSFDKFCEIVKKPKSADVFVVDTVQYFGGVDFERYYDLRVKHPNKLFIYVSHCVGKDPDGKVAVQLMRDSKLKIWVEGFRAQSKGRYIGRTGYYTVWEERATKYYDKDAIKE